MKGLCTGTEVNVQRKQMMERRLYIRIHLALRVWWRLHRNGVLICEDEPLMSLSYL
jgi:hypothetical protein